MSTYYLLCHHQQPILNTGFSHYRPLPLELKTKWQQKQALIDQYLGRYTAYCASDLHDFFCEASWENWLLEVLGFVPDYVCSAVPTLVKDRNSKYNDFNIHFLESDIAKYSLHFQLYLMCSDGTFGYLICKMWGNN